MKKHLTLMGLMALSMGTLQGGSALVEVDEKAPKAPEVGVCGVCCDRCEMLNPYKNSECDPTFTLDVGFVSGFVGPLNVVSATSGQADGFTGVTPPAPLGTFYETKIKNSSGIEFSTGFTGPGRDATAVHFDTVMFRGHKCNLTTNFVSAPLALSTFPLIVATDADATAIDPNLRAEYLARLTGIGGQYINSAFVYSTFVLAKPLCSSKCSLLLSEIGFSNTYLNHTYNVLYTEAGGAFAGTPPPTAVNTLYSTNEVISAIGPLVRFRARQLLVSCFTLEGMMGVAGSYQKQDVAVTEITTTVSATGATSTPTSRVNTAKCMKRWTNLVEGKVGINFHACFDRAKGFCAARDCPNVKGFTAIELGLSWNFQCRDAFTMVTAAPFGLGAGTMQPWIAQWAALVVTVKI